MNKKIWLMMLGIMVISYFFCGSVFADTEDEETALWVSLLTSDVALKIIVSIGVFLWGLFKAKGWFKNKREKIIIESIEQAVTELYFSMVRNLKEKRADGKLTDDDIKSLQNTAWLKAKAIAEKNGVKLGKYIAEAYVPVIISKIIAGLKK